MSMMNNLIENNTILTKQVSSLQTQNNELRLELQKKTDFIKEKDVKIAALQEQIAAKSTGIANLKVNPRLSRILKEIYPKLEEMEKFKTEQVFNADHNRSVAENLKKLISETESQFSDEEVLWAIKSRYQSEKKLTKTTAESSQHCRRVTRRHTKLRARKGVANTHNLHVETINKLTANDMSDEESFVEGNTSTLKVKKPTWRKPELEQILAEVDVKALDTARQLRKQRVVGSPSTRVKP